MTLVPTPRARRSRRAAAALVSLALLPATAALTAAPASAQDAGHHSGPVAARQLDVPGTPAGDLRAVLAAAFQEHSAFGAITASAYVLKGDRLGDAAAAQTAAIRQELARAVGGLSPRSAALRDALAARDTAKLGYALAVDRRRRTTLTPAQAEAAVAATRAPVARSLAALVPGVPATSTVTLLAAQDAREARAAQALGVRSPTVYQRVQEAHLGTAPLAAAVAAALDAARGLAGSATSPASTLRARSVNLHAAHVVQVGLASDSALRTGLRSRDYAGAKQALDVNTAQITAFVDETTYDANAYFFNRQWNRHIRDYATFILGLQTRNAGLRTLAALDLGDFARDNAAQVARVGGLPPATLVPQLRIHVGGTITVIRLQAAGDPRQYAAARLGTDHFAQVGDLLGSGAAVRLRLAP